MLLASILNIFVRSPTFVYVSQVKSKQTLAKNVLEIRLEFRIFLNYRCNSFLDSSLCQHSSSTTLKWSWRKSAWATKTTFGILSPSLWTWLQSSSTFLSSWPTRNKTAATGRGAAAKEWTTKKKSQLYFKVWDDTCPNSKILLGSKPIHPLPTQRHHTHILQKKTFIGSLV